MKSTCYRLTIALFAILALSVPVLGQTSGDDAHRHLVRGMAAVEMAWSDEELGADAASSGNVSWAADPRTNCQVGYVNEARERGRL